jgi:hypothetical protein
MLRKFAASEHLSHPLQFWWVLTFSVKTIGENRRVHRAKAHCPPRSFSSYVSRLEAESYRTLPRADLLLNRARAIAERYLVPGGIRSVPLSDSVQERILVCCDSELVGPGLFIDAQVQVGRTRNLLPNSLQDSRPVTTDFTQLAYPEGGATVYLVNSFFLLIFSTEPCCRRCTNGWKLSLCQSSFRAPHTRPWPPEPNPQLAP